MNVSSSHNKRAGLTQGAFDNLLARLDQNKDRAGEKYEYVRKKLVRFFESRHCIFPEDHADEAINRVARKLSEGTVIQDISTYSLGIARMLFLEVLKDCERGRVPLEHLPELRAEPEGQSPSDPRLECFESCLDNLPPENKEIIIKYYQGEKKAKIDSRRQLALQMDIPLNALRIRTHRIREKLEQCVNECLNQ